MHNSALVFWANSRIHDAGGIDLASTGFDRSLGDLEIISAQ